MAISEASHKSKFLATDATKAGLEALARDLAGRGVKPETWKRRVQGAFGEISAIVKYAKDGIIEIAPKIADLRLFRDAVVTFEGKKVWLEVKRLATVSTKVGKDRVTSQIKSRSVRHGLRCDRD